MRGIIKIKSLKQKGMTLIGLMIGLFISMMCILSSLTLYKNMIHTAAESKIDNLHDGQLAAAMLTVQLGLQNAGFGIESADLSHIQKIQVSNELQLLWRFYDGTQFKCVGIKELGGIDVTNQLNYRAVELIEADIGCTKISPLVDLNWKTLATLGRWYLLPDATTGLTKHIAENSTLLNIVGPTPVECSPAGDNTRGNFYSLVITAPSSIKLNGAISNDNNYEYCLANISQPAGVPGI